MNLQQRHFWIYLLLFMASACVEPYDPPVDKTNVNFLVVDAFLNASDGSVNVNITRSLPVSSTVIVPVESGAFVSVEQEGGSTHVLQETTDGVYTGVIDDISYDKQYRLHIQTQDEEIYTSDLISIKDTPPVGDIRYAMVRDGLQFSVSTADQSGQSAYFRWKYWETYEYRSYYKSIYLYMGDTIDVRPAELDINTCWRSLSSTDIFVTSTKSLTQSVVSNFPLVVIPRGSIKVSRKYSLLVQQQALTVEAYEYWLNLQRTTEQLGGLFDPLPYEVGGNIRCTTDPNKKVIGFFSGSSLQEKRIFVDSAQVPMEMHIPERPFCPVDTLFLEDLHTVNETTLLMDVIAAPGGGVIGYTVSGRACIDCRVKGGLARKPDFWE